MPTTEPGGPWGFKSFNTGRTGNPAHAEFVGTRAVKPTWSKKRPPRDAPRHAERPTDAADAGGIRIFGIHAVEAVLRNDRRTIKRVLVTDNAERRLAEALAARKVEPIRVAPRDLDRDLGDDTVHQGALVMTEPLPEPTLEDLCAAAEHGGPLIVLDQVTDPHNVGAILRSAAGFGASGLIMTRRHSPPLAGALAKTASGALEHVPVALVGNLAQALAVMAEAYVRRLGLDGDAEMLIDTETFAGATALVLGAEGKGLRRLTRDLCDGLCRIGASGGLASLNVSNAAAVALYAASMRRRKT